MVIAEMHAIQLISIDFTTEHACACAYEYIYIYAMIGQFVGHAHAVHGRSTAEIVGHVLEIEVHMHDIL